MAWIATACIVGAVPRTACASIDGAPIVRQQQDDLERLRAMLEQVGPDGREAREAAITRLLGMPRPEAHQILQERFLHQEDTDGVRAAILDGLQRQLAASPGAQFGGAGDAPRRRILTDYLRVLAPMWRNAAGAGAGDTTAAAADALRKSARIALHRVPARELDVAARALLVAGDVEQRCVVLRCLADMRQTMFAQTIADYLDIADPDVQTAARESLQQLTCAEEAIRTKAQFDAWFAANGTTSYVELMERAARLGSRPLERLRDENSRLRVDVAREVVRAHVVQTPGIDWAAVQGKVVVDDPKVLDACLELLQQTLPTTSPGDDGGPARQAFCRALLQRFRQVAPDQLRRRALLLEVASYVGRAEDGDLATELVGLLLAQLETVTDVETRLAALRGLRRYPSPETRGRLVASARSLLDEPAAARAQLTTILATLTARTTPRWTAPLAEDADKAAWLALVAALCRSDAQLELREQALQLAQSSTARDQRVPEVFALLVELVRDQNLGPKFRSTCAIHLQGWRTEAEFAEEWVKVEQELLRDPAPELRKQAAESLARLASSIDPDRAKWIASTILAVRERLPGETEPAVQVAMVDCLQDCGREPQMPEKAIGALLYVLAEIPAPVPNDRLERLLLALATIAQDSRADRGQWLAACQPLIDHRRRHSLRLVLQSHAGADLAKDVGSADAGLAARARSSMEVIIETATLKPPREAWTGSEELMREAREVRAAFAALDQVDGAQRPDKPVHRLLRLEVDLAERKYQDVVQRATAWLGNGHSGTNGNGSGNGAASSMSVDEKSRMRVLAAEAQLALGRADAAKKLVDERGAEAQPDAAVLDLEFRIARALVATDLAGAVALFERVLRGTPVEDPMFRVRLVEWGVNRVRFDPSLRGDTQREAQEHAALFASADCPPELRAQFEGLRAQR